MRYKSILEPRQHWLDRPLQHYDDEGLQACVLRPFKVKRALYTDNVSTALDFSFSVDHGRPAFASKLIRGGRWLLLGSERCDILLIDLDARDILPRILIPSPFDTTPLEAYPLIAIEMDDGAPYLTFNLALAIFCRSKPTVIQVWKVTAIPDHRGRVADLKADQLVTFAEEQPNYRINTISLQERFLVYSVREKNITTIVDWTSVEQFPRRRVLIGFSDVCLHAIFTPHH